MVITKYTPQHIEIQKNEDGIEELGFKDKDKAEKFVHTMSKLSCLYRKIENCKYANISKCFKLWENATKINQSDEPVNDKYCVNIDKVKVRYINPLVEMNNNKFERVNKISEKADIDIENTLNYKTKKYAYLDFDLEKEEI